jgi:polyisoprenyl-phosphate glycosyltransferase
MDHPPVHKKMTVGVIVPVYNEGEVITSFHEQLCQVIDALSYAFQVLYVNDGSTDETASRLEQIMEADNRVTLIELSRNFGHQAALTAGIDRVEADYVIMMDGDGEHPPGLIPEMLALAEAGYDIVLTQRMDNKLDSSFKKISSSLFYKIVNRIGETRILPGGADFRLLTRPALEALRSMREYHRFLRGMVVWTGYRQVILPYQPNKRLGAKSKFSLTKMVGLGMNAIFSFSLIPMYLGISMGIGFLLLAFLESVYVLNFWLRGDIDHLAPGWSSLMFIILIVGGISLILQGVIGVYVGFTFQEVKKRPIYLVRREISQRATTREEIALDISGVQAIRTEMNELD